MKRLLPGVPFLAALLIVMIAAVNLATSKRFPIYSSDGATFLTSNNQCSEPKILPAVTVGSPLPNNFHLLDLEELVIQSLTSSSKSPVFNDLDSSSSDVPKLSHSEEVIWSSVTLSNKKDRIAFYSNTGLYVVNLRTSQPVKVYSLPNGGNLEFFDAITWSPDDTYLTFGQVPQGFQAKASSSRQYALGLVQMATGKSKIIHYSGRLPRKPVWSPDGQYLAGEDPVAIYDVKLANLTQIPTGYTTRNPQWSPDGRHVVFFQYSSPNRGETFRYTLDTKEVLQITALGKAASPVDWLKSPSTILFETETNSGETDLGRHHVGEVKPHMESSIRWLSPFDRYESNRFLGISPNERYVILRKTEPPKTGTTPGNIENTPNQGNPSNPSNPSNTGNNSNVDNFGNTVDLVAVNRELSFFSWRCVKLHSFTESPRMTLQWTKDNKLLYLGDRQSGRNERNRKWELFLFDFDQLSEQKIWESRTPARLVGVDGNVIYYCPY